MFDLLVRDAEAAALVPVPLPGRVMLFAGPGGVLHVRREDGSFVPELVAPAPTPAPTPEPGGQS